MPRQTKLPIRVNVVKNHKKLVDTNGPPCTFPDCDCPMHDFIGFEPAPEASFCRAGK